MNKYLAIIAIGLVVTLPQMAGAQDLLGIYQQNSMPAIRIPIKDMKRQPTESEVLMEAQQKLREAQEQSLKEAQQNAERMGLQTDNLILRKEINDLRNVINQYGKPGNDYSLADKILECMDTDKYGYADFDEKTNSCQCEEGTVVVAGKCQPPRTITKVEFPSASSSVIVGRVTRQNLLEPQPTNSLKTVPNDSKQIVSETPLVTPKIVTSSSTTTTPHQLVATSSIAVNPSTVSKFFNLIAKVFGR